MKYTYLAIDLATLFIPLMFSFHPRIKFTREWKYFFPANLIVALIFLSWDILFTYHGHWNFNPDKVLGIYFLGLPIEEILFFFCIPYACIFTWHCYSLIATPPRFHIPSTLFISAFILLLIAIVFHDRMYTLYCFSLSALLLWWLRKESWMSTGLPVFLLLLIPFMVVNGLLTGMGSDAPVVIYSSRAIMGPRIFSIPVEDIFYALSLFLSNLWVYNKLRIIIPTSRTKHVPQVPVHV